MASLLKKLLSPRVPPASADAGIALGPDRREATSIAGESAKPHSTAVIAEAEAHNVAGRFAQALALLDHALAATPDDPSLLVARGSTLYEWGRVLEARQTFLAAHARGSNDADHPLKLGWSCVAGGLHNEALPWMSKAVASKTESTKAWLGFAIASQ